MTQEWVSTGEAVRILHHILGPRQFVRVYKCQIPCCATPGGHLRWSKYALECLAMEHEQTSKLSKS